MADAIPAGAYCFELSATFNAHTITRELRRGETLPAQVWAKVVVDQGELVLKQGSPARETRIAAGQEGILPPGTHFACANTGEPVHFHIEYYHEPKLKDAAALLSQLGGRPRPSA